MVVNNIPPDVVHRSGLKRTSRSPRQELQYCNPDPTFVLGWRGVYKEVGEETESGSFSEERWSAKGEEEGIIWEVSLCSPMFSLLIDGETIINNGDLLYR